MRSTGSKVGRFVLVAIFLALTACQNSGGEVGQSSTGQTPTSQSTIGTTPSSSIGAQPTSGSNCTNIDSSGYQTGPASASWSAPRDASSAPITSVAASDDTLKFAFQSGTPEWRVQRNPGSPASEYLNLVGFGRNPPTGDPLNYPGPKSISSSGPQLLKADETWDTQGQMRWTVALASPGCAIVTSVGSNLSFRFVASSR